jgi:hypothetical protein
MARQSANREGRPSPGRGLVRQASGAFAGGNTRPGSLNVRAARPATVRAPGRIGILRQTPRAEIVAAEASPALPCLYGMSGEVYLLPPLGALPAVTALMQPPLRSCCKLGAWVSSSMYPAAQGRPGRQQTSPPQPHRTRTVHVPTWFAAMALFTRQPEAERTRVAARALASSRAWSGSPEKHVAAVCRAWAISAVPPSLNGSQVCRAFAIGPT